MTSLACVYDGQSLVSDTCSWYFKCPITEKLRRLLLWCCRPFENLAHQVSQAFLGTYLVRLPTSGPLRAPSGSRSGGSSLATGALHISQEPTRQLADAPFLALLKCFLGD
jgi:hypothetical protein